MSMLMRSHTWLYGGAVIGIAIALYALVMVVRGPEVTYVTGTVEKGTIQEVVSVSGVIQGDNTAELSFPVTGTVASILVTEGDNVALGDTLVALDTRALQAERKQAISTLNIAEADRRELVAGPRSEERDITALNVSAAKAELERITAEEDEKVKNARRTLLSSDLEAFPLSKDTTNVPPTISGIYTCETEGAYELEMFASGAQSGYSYKLTGLESGIDSAYVTNPDTLGSCGLRIVFPADARFGSTDWVIPVPNKNGASYVANLNAYELAKQQRDNKIAAAKEAYDLASKEQTLENATPRSEALDRADAAVLQGVAKVGAIDAAIAERILKAPFPGIVTDITAKVGETVGTTPILTMVSDEAFTLTARIPEIDIAKIEVGQKAAVVFDAAANETVEAELAFVSPLATEIDGVAYFEAKLRFPNPPSWLKVGLNADVDIVVAEAKDVLKVPKRFLQQEGNDTYLLIRENDTTVKQMIKTGFSGNDGYTEVFDIEPGTTIVAP